jgi:hypothetical protein
MVKRNRSFRLALPHNDLLHCTRSVIDAIESRGGVFSNFKDNANKINASVFTTRVGAAEIPESKAKRRRSRTPPLNRSAPLCSYTLANVTSKVRARRIISQASYPCKIQSKIFEDYVRTPTYEAFSAHGISIKASDHPARTGLILYRYPNPSGRAKPDACGPQKPRAAGEMHGVQCKWPGFS